MSAKLGAALGGMSSRLSADRLRLIRNTADKLADIPLADVNLVLHEYRLEDIHPTSWSVDSWNQYGEEDDIRAYRRSIITRVLREVPQEKLSALAVTVQQLFDSPQASAEVSSSQPLTLFASHLSTQKALVSSIADQLRNFAVNMFVAHVDIEPDSEWHARIEDELRDSHAGVVFLYPGFNESKWCDQEVGWLLGRGVPVLPLKFAEQDPYGPLGKKQADTVGSALDSLGIATKVLDWVRTKPTLSIPLSTSLATALSLSGSFQQTDAIWSRLRTSFTLTDDQVATIASAVRDNSQVYYPDCRVPGAGYGTPYSQIIITWLTQQPGFAANQQLINEVASARGLSHLLADTGSPDVNGLPLGTTDDDEPPF